MTLAPQPGGHTASGGVISDFTSGSDVYRAHIFTSSGTFTVSSIGELITKLSISSSAVAAVVEIMKQVVVVQVDIEQIFPEGPGGGGSAEATYTIATGAYTVTVGTVVKVEQQFLNHQVLKE